MIKKFVLLAGVLLFTSCIGVKADISLKRDLSGTIRLVYTVSRDFLGAGTLDGNARWPSLPVGKADFERTVARIDGLALRSWHEKDKGGDRVFEAALDFDSLDSLSNFLDANGQRLVSESANGKQTLRFLFTDGSPVLDNGLLSAVEKTFSGYSFDFSISVPGDKKTFTRPMGALLTSAQKEMLEITF